jgi:hypothetical protein
MKNAVFWDVMPCGSCKNRGMNWGFISQKTIYFIVSAVETSDVTYENSVTTSKRGQSSCNDAERCHATNSTFTAGIFTAAAVRECVGRH